MNGEERLVRAMGEIARVTKGVPLDDAEHLFTNVARRGAILQGFVDLFEMIARAPWCDDPMLDGMSDHLERLLRSAEEAAEKVAQEFDEA